MWRYFILSSLSVILFSATIYAEEPALKDATTSLPPEMLHKGKPIDPTCVYAAMRHKGAEGINLKDSCEEIKWLQASDEGYNVIQSSLSTRPSSAIGYYYDLGKGRSGDFFYRFLGETNEGLLLHTYYSSGGSGHFSDLSVYKRKGESLSKVRTIVGGDRCSRGIRDAKIENGDLRYSYNVTPLELYQHYVPNAKYRGDLGSGFVNCGAVFYMKNGTLERVDLVEDAIFPSCFKDEYIKQVTLEKTLSAAQAKELILRFSQACPAEPTP